MQIKESEIKALVSALFACKVASAALKKTGHADLAEGVEKEIDIGMNILESVVTRRMVLIKEPED